MISLPDPDAGFVFATTGPRYTDLARRAVRSLRQVMPDAAVDLFTDQPLEDPAFDRIVPLDHDWFRPKMEALRRSRFRRTVHLDADCIVIADIGDIFDILDRFDVAGAHHFYRNWALGRTPSKVGAPPAFPQIVSAVLGIRRSEATEALLRAWEETVRETGAKKDQPTLRDLLWTSDLRLYVLPLEYNVHNPVSSLPHWDSIAAAPRVLHIAQLQNPPFGDPETPFDPADALGPDIAAQLKRLLAADPTLGGDPVRSVPALSYSVRHVLRRRLSKGLPALLRAKMPER